MLSLSAILRLTSTLALTAALLACGGGGGGGNSGNPPATNGSGSPPPVVAPAPEFQTGIFLDSAVGNIAYRTATQSGFTNEQGHYSYVVGETVVFSIGDVELPATQAQAVVTPLDLVGTSDINDVAVINIARLLQSLDVDGDPDNGIMLDDACHLAATGLSIDFEQNITESVVNLIANSGSVTHELIDVDTALAHLEGTLNSITGGDVIVTGPDVWNVGQYFPVDTSVEYYFNNSTQPTRFSGSKVINGKNITPLVHPTGGKEYFYPASDGLAFYGFYSPLVRVSGVGNFTIDVSLSQPVIVLEQSWQSSESVSVSGTGTVNISPTYGQQNISYSGNVEYFGEENISTPAGNYDTRHFSLDLDVDAVIDGYAFSIPMRTDIWLTPELGIVKRIDSGVTFLLTRFVGPDSDGDGVLDSSDAFPQDPNEFEDTDGDGIGNNADTDDDGDGTADNSDAFPLDDTETADSDSDGIGDNSDKFPSNPPEITLIYDPLAKTYQSVTVSAAINYANAEIVSYDWQQLSGTTATVANAGNSATLELGGDNAELLEFRFTVQDANGVQYTINFVIEVTPNFMPVIEFPDNLIVDEGVAFQLSGDVASDSDGEIT